MSVFRKSTSNPCITDRTTIIISTPTAMPRMEMIVMTDTNVRRGRR